MPNMKVAEPVDHFYYYKEYPNGENAGVVKMIYTWRLCSGNDDYGYENSWCYEHLADAIEAAERWDGEGEPTGWHRHPHSGRRRPGGDPDKEYVNP